MYILEKLFGTYVLFLLSTSILVRKSTLGNYCLSLCEANQNIRWTIKKIEFKWYTLADITNNRLFNFKLFF